MILVDVCGKGTAAGPAALQFAGALGGLLGALPPEQLFQAANDFLLRQRDDESFATAVHLIVDLERGRLRRSPAPGTRRRCAGTCRRGEWVIDNARGTALGVLRGPRAARQPTAGCSPARRCSSTPTA